MRLGIDLDGVVANFTAGWMSFYNRDFGTTLAFEDASDWGDPVNLTHFRSMRDFWRWSKDLDGRSVFWHLEPFDDAVAALQDLDSAGHELVILTSKPDFAISDTHDWIEHHQIPAADVHIIERKWMVDCDVYIDDGPYVLPGLVRHRGDRLVCRRVQAWNRPLEGVVDVVGLTEFRQLVDGLG